MSNIEKFLSASMDEMKRGYAEEPEHYVCLLCGEKTEKGVIYQQRGHLYDAEKQMKLHINKIHRSVFEYLIGLDKKITGLSEHQNGLLRLFYQGKSDAEVQREMGIGSSSTIRNHRFVLKERERQAKVFLVLMELMKERDKKSPGLIPPHKTATMVDDRYNITEEENGKILKKYFPYGVDGPLKTFAMKEKSKLVVLRQIVKRFEADRIYREKEVNEILKEVHEDFASLRRYLIEYGFMDRKPDGSQYWVKEGQDGPIENRNELKKGPDGLEGKAMDNRKELIQQYKEMKKEAGVYQIRNTKNQKVFVVSTPNLKTINGKRFELQMGGQKNQQLQKEWNEYGEEAFVFEVLEVLEEKQDGFFDLKEELKKLEAKWLDKLQPYGERGYNYKAK